MCILGLCCSELRELWDDSFVGTTSLYEGGLSPLFVGFFILTMQWPFGAEVSDPF